MALALESLNLVSASFEYLIPEQRPYFSSGPGALDEPSLNIGHVVTVDIDEAGSGKIEDFYENTTSDNYEATTKAGTRTNSNNAVEWNGFYDLYLADSAFSDYISYYTKSSLIDAQTISQTGSFDRYGSTTNIEDIFVSYDLTGAMISDSTECAPTSGTITINPNQFANETVISTISKEINDLYWTVTVAITSLNNQALDEYQVDSLGATFYCDFDF